MTHPYSPINPCLGGDCGKYSHKTWDEPACAPICDNCYKQIQLEEAMSAAEPETRISDEDYHDLMMAHGDVEARSEEIRQGWADDARDAIMDGGNS